MAAQLFPFHLPQQEFSLFFKARSGHSVQMHVQPRQPVDRLSQFLSTSQTQAQELQSQGKSSPDRAHLAYGPKNRAIDSQHNFSPRTTVDPGRRFETTSTQT